MEPLKEAENGVRELGRMPNSSLATPMKVYMYAVTIKPTHKLMIYKSNNSRQFFENKIFEMIVNYRLIQFNLAFEYDSKGNIHAHLTVGSYDPKLTFMVKGWHIYITPKYNDNWENYMNKDYRIEDWNNSKYYETHYGFIDNEHNELKCAL